MTDDTAGKQNAVLTSSIAREFKAFNTASLKENIVYIFSDESDDGANGEDGGGGSEPEVLEILSHSETSTSNDQLESSSRSNHRRSQRPNADRRNPEITFLTDQSDMGELSILPASIGRNTKKAFHDSDIHTMFDLTDERIVEDLTKSPPRGHGQHSDNPQCRICMDVLVEPAATECGHVFCMACLLAAMERQPLCPLCRQRSHVRKIRRLYI
ncbi:hypothetical protein MDAP_002663 [Mitosporidium daphniae]